MFKNLLHRLLHCLHRCLRVEIIALTIGAVGSLIAQSIGSCIGLTVFLVIAIWNAIRGE